MSGKKIAFSLYGLVILVCVLMSVVYAFKQSGENSEIEAYLSEVNLSDDLSAWEAAVVLSTRLRTEFEVEESNYRELDMANRPFLRETTSKLLRIKEGQCGEGTRVLVNLLLAQGYNATRVSLYDINLNSSHTLVSLQDGGEEYFIDSINTREEVNQFLNTQQINADDFSIVKYQDDVTARSDASRAIKSAEEEQLSEVEERFFNRFKYYSYEALPYTKLYSALGFDVRLLNFDRPPEFLSGLAEKPYAIVSFVWAGLAFGLVLLALFWWFCLWIARLCAKR